MKVIPERFVRKCVVLAHKRLGHGESLASVLSDLIHDVYAMGAAAERERIIAANAPEIEKVNVYIKALEDAVAAEREACAKVCEEWLHGEWHNQGVIAALMIRERGQA